MENVSNKIKDNGMATSQIVGINLTQIICQKLDPSSCDGAGAFCAKKDPLKTIRA
jgi:hypothetical protein